VVPDLLGSCSFLATPERHLNDLAPRSFNGAFLSYIKTDLGFGGLGIVLLEDYVLVRDSTNFSDPRGIGQSCVLAFLGHPLITYLDPNSFVDG
jgi:hypothetical protein